ncbi:MAG TPA: class I SAM-dependent methyltransferase, partial [Chthoniobacterales bacterium]
MGTKPNTYSRRWFEFFHSDIDETRTLHEVDFICCFAPLPDFSKVLDICCGTGRHARVLSNRGYSVTGVDCDSEAIASARKLAGGPIYVQTDFLDYQPEDHSFDLAIVMGQSFGYHDASTNRALLGRVVKAVRTGGRVILDLWNPDFFAANQGDRDLPTKRGIVKETKRVLDERLFVHLNYPDGEEEDFEWQLFTPPQLRQLAQSVGFDLLVSCSSFDQTQSPDRINPRVQF